MMAMAREAVLCPRCGALNRPTWEFCARCNESLQKAQRFEVAEGGLQEDDGRPASASSGNGIAFLALVVFVGGGIWAWRTVANSQPPSRPDPAVFSMPTLPASLSTPAPETAPGLADYAEARRLAAAGDTSGAAERFAAALVAAPDNAEFHNGFSQFLWRTGDREGALRERAQAARLDPRLQLEYARLLEIVGRTEDAVREYEGVLANNPGASVVHVDIGRLFFRAGDYRRAAEHLQAAIQIQPDDAVVQQELAYALDQTGSREQAEAVYRRVLTQVPRASMTRSLLAANLSDRGRRDEALAVLREGLRVSPDAPSLHRELGNVLWVAGRDAEAAAAFAEYLRLAPNAPDARAVAARRAQLIQGGAGGASMP